MLREQRLDRSPNQGVNFLLRTHCRDQVYPAWILFRQGQKAIFNPLEEFAAGFFETISLRSGARLATLSARLADLDRHMQQESQIRTSVADSEIDHRLHRREVEPAAECLVRYRRVVEAV